MSEGRQVYLREDEVENVISALAGSTTARDLAEAIGRSEEEVLTVLTEMRAAQQPPSELELLREQNLLLQKQIDELGQRNRGLSPRTKFRLFAAGAACFALISGLLFFFTFSSARKAEPEAVPTQAAPVAETSELPPASTTIAPTSRTPDAAIKVGSATN